MSIPDLTCYVRVTSLDWTMLNCHLGLPFSWEVWFFNCSCTIPHFLLSSSHYSLVVTGILPGTAGEVAPCTSLPQPIWSPEPQRRGQRQEVPRLPQRFHWTNCLKHPNCTRGVCTYMEVATIPGPSPPT